MKVLEKGREQNGWAEEYQCTGQGNGGGGCGSKLLVEEGDLFKTSSSDYTGDTTTYITFQCPCCKNFTDVRYSSVPSRIANKLPNKNWLVNGRPEPVGEK